MKFDIGLLCPMCNSVYKADFDDGDTLVEGASTMHCPKCKKHPAMLIITRYKAESVKMVRKYPDKKVQPIKSKLVTV